MGVQDLGMEAQGIRHGSSGLGTLVQYEVL